MTVTKKPARSKAAAPKAPQEQAAQAFIEAATIAPQPLTAEESFAAADIIPVGMEISELGKPKKKKIKEEAVTTADAGGQTDTADNKKKKKKRDKKKHKKKEAVLIRFDEAQLAQIDERADAMDLSRAAWVRMAVTLVLERA